MQKHLQAQQDKNREKQAQLYKMRKRLTRKFRCSQREKDQSEKQFLIKLFEQKGTLPIESLTNLNYFLKKAKLSKIQNDFQIGQSYQSYKISDSEQVRALEAIQQIGRSFYLRKQNIGLFTTEVYQVQRPTLIIEDKDILSSKPFGHKIRILNNLFVEKLTEVICALANQPDGGDLLICRKHSNFTIQCGLRNFSLQDLDILRQNIQTALKRIAFHENIFVKIEGLSLYFNLKEKIEGKKSEQFVLKIVVSPSSCNTCFYIKQTNSFLMIVKRFRQYRINESIGEQGYGLILKVQKQRAFIRKKNIVAVKQKTTKIRIEIALSFWDFISELPSQDFFLSIKTNKLLPLLYEDLHKVRIEEKQIQQIVKVNQFQTMFQIQLNVEFAKETIQEIGRMIANISPNHKIIFPLPELQKKTFQTKKEVFFQIQMNYIYYVAIDASFQKFSAIFRKKFNEVVDSKITINWITQDIYTDSQIILEEILFITQAVNQKFGDLSIISISDNPYIKGDLHFRAKDKSSALLANFIMTLSGLKPQIFSNTTDQLLTSIISALFKVGRTNIHHQFAQLQHIAMYDNYFQFQISDVANPEETIQIIKSVFTQWREWDLDYKFVIPMPQLQKQIIKFRKQKDPKFNLSCICYFVYNRWSLAFFKALSSNFIGDEQQRMVRNTIYSKIQTKMKATYGQVQYFNKFMKLMFESNLSIKYYRQKKEVSPRFINNQIFQSVKVSFFQKDTDTIFAFFIFTLSNKRPE